MEGHHVGSVALSPWFEFSDVAIPSELPGPWAVSISGAVSAMFLVPITQPDLQLSPIASRRAHDQEPGCGVSYLGSGCKNRSSQHLSFLIHKMRITIVATPLGHWENCITYFC